MFRKDKASDCEIDGILHRLCDRCQQFKPLGADFYLCSDRKSRRHKCRTCVDLERRERGTAWTPEQKREARIRKVYGLRVEQFDDMWESQNGKCKICEEGLTIQSKNTETNINIDHCHDTGVVRGLLCSRCNRGLGQFRDRQDLLHRAAAYLDGPFIQPKGLLTPEERGTLIKGKKLPRITYETIGT